MDDDAPKIVNLIIIFNVKIVIEIFIIIITRPRHIVTIVDIVTINLFILLMIMMIFVGLSVGLELCTLVMLSSLVLTMFTLRWLTIIIIIIHTF